MKTLLSTILFLALLCTPVLGQTILLQENTGHEVLGLTTHPYTAITLTRLSDMEDWSTGLVFGVEIDTGQNGFAGVEFESHDILTGEGKGIVPWDSSVRLRLGMYW